MSAIITQLHNVEPQQIINPINDLKKQIEDLKKSFQPKEPTEYLTRQEVVEMLKINLSTLYNWTKNKKLVSYGIGARVYYKRKEIENAIIKLNH
jgi:prefoldin subunit 5